MAGVAGGVVLALGIGNLLMGGADVFVSILLTGFLVFDIDLCAIIVVGFSGSP